MEKKSESIRWLEEQSKSGLATAEMFLKFISGFSPEAREAYADLAVSAARNAMMGIESVKKSGMTHEEIIERMTKPTQEKKDVK